MSEVHVTDFAAVWNSCETIEEVCRRTGKTKRQAANLAASRRRRGTEMKYLNRGQSLVGQKFHRLCVLEEIQKTGHERKYLCRCDCGKMVKVNTSKLKTGKTKSCGCWSREHATKHGCSWKNGKAAPTQAYQAWCGMNERCRNPNAARYARYGGRGIRVCERWQTFENFLADMGEPPFPGLSIDRKNNDGNYEPGNCRWATQKEQANNTCRNISVTIGDRTQTLVQWCEESGMKANTILCRIRRGWTPQRALAEPIGEWRR